MSRVLLRMSGGDLCLPDPTTIMVDRADGGQLVVNPPRRVWERTALELPELVAWNLLVAATGRAMLECLPQLDGGCVNYWDAGNWALNDAAEPAGPKRGPAHRVLHQHVIGRSRHSSDPAWRWGESPFFPAFADRVAWSRGKASLTPAECAAIVARVREVLLGVYAVPAGDLLPGATCVTCGHPSPLTLLESTGRCAICADEWR
jgi:hypothetical protein